MKKLFFPFCILTLNFPFLSINSFAQLCFYPHTEYSVGSNSNTKAITTGDFNNDNIPDLAVAIVTPSMVSIVLGNGTGSFSLASSYTIANTQPYAIVSNDFNNDGKADVAVANNGSALQGVTILLGNGAGLLTAAYSYTTTGVNPAGIASGDFNGDGKKDVAITNYNSSPGRVSVYFGNGNGTMGAGVSYSVGTNPYGIVCADVTGDGAADLVTANSGSNDVTVLWNVNGTGTFQVAGTFSTGSGTGPKELVAVDMNGDNKLDLITCNNTTSNVSVLLNNISGQYSAANTYLAGTGPLGITTADFDGDGKADVAIANSNSNNVSVLRGDGAGGLYTPPTNFTTAAKPVKLASADFNGDGKKDIATANQDITSYNTSILLNSLPGPIAITGNTTICSGSPTTLTASGASSYAWNNGMTTSSITVNPTTHTMYSVNGTNSSCTVTATGTKTVTVNTLPAVTANASTTTVTVCTEAIVTLTGGGALSYTWSGGITDGVGFIPSSTATYTVTGTDVNGCSNVAVITINVVPPATPSICLVTVDSASDYNIIVWDKTSYTNVDSFLIYREIATGNFQPIGAVHYDSLSLFIDTVRTKYFPNSGDPNAGTYQYKIQVRDTCGNYSQLSPFHNTIYMTNNNGSFSWTQPYTIQGISNPVNSYVLMRDDDNDGNWNPINSVSGTQQTVTDPAYASWQATANYHIRTMWNISCTPTIKYPQPMGINTSKSNNYKTTGPTSTHESTLENSVNIFPNPNKGEFNVSCSSLKAQGLEVFTIYGEKVHLLTQSGVRASDTRHWSSVIDMSSQPGGIYFLQLKTEQGVVTKKLVLNK